MRFIIINDVVYNLDNLINFNFIIYEIPMLEPCKKFSIWLEFINKKLDIEIKVFGCHNKTDSLNLKLDVLNLKFIDFLESDEKILYLDKFIERLK